MDRPALTQAVQGQLPLPWTRTNHLVVTPKARQEKTRRQYHRHKLAAVPALSVDSSLETTTKTRQRRAVSHLRGRPT